MPKQRNITYIVDVEKMARPLGACHFAARPVFPKDFDASQFRVPPPACEVYGADENEARMKVVTAMDRWATKCEISVTPIP
jgi:hypothetical protein